MKKSLLGLAVTLIAFFFGVLAVKIFLIKREIVFAKPAAENLEVFENSYEQVPRFGIRISPPVSSAETDERLASAKFADQGIYGWYSLEDFGKMPEVNMILLSGSNFDDDGNPTEKMNLSAGVYTNLSDDIDEGFAEAARAKIEDGKVKFKTRKLKGIRYEFEGTFFKNKTMGDDGEKLLRGTLKKFVKGKKVAETSGDFVYYEPHCLH